MKNYKNEKCCLNCDSFHWWDGDYCCIRKWKIHQYGYGHENGGFFAYPGMNEDIDNTMKTPETCKEYEYTSHNEDIEEEYKKFKEYQKMQNEYYKFTK